MERVREPILIIQVDKTVNGYYDYCTAADCVDPVGKTPVLYKVAFTSHLKKSADRPSPPHKITVNIVFQRLFRPESLHPVTVIIILRFQLPRPACLNGHMCSVEAQDDVTCNTGLCILDGENEGNR